MREEKEEFRHIVSEAPEELSEYDRKLLKAVLTTTKEYLIESKRTRLEINKLLNKALSSIRELIAFGVVVSSGWFFYNNLPSEAKAKVAEDYLGAGITLVTGTAGAAQFMKNKKDNEEMRLIEEKEKDEIREIARRYDGEL